VNCDEGVVVRLAELERAEDPDVGEGITVVGSSTEIVPSLNGVVPIVALSVVGEARSMSVLAWGPHAI
jgi:hypothetical protein